MLAWHDAPLGQCTCSNCSLEIALHAKKLLDWLEFGVSPASNTDVRFSDAASERWHWLHLHLAPQLAGDVGGNVAAVHVELQGEIAVRQQLPGRPWTQHIDHHIS
jgi:hypothetical protein